MKKKFLHLETSIFIKKIAKKAFSYRFHISCCKIDRGRCLKLHLPCYRLFILCFLKKFGIRPKAHQWNILGLTPLLWLCQNSTGSHRVPYD